VESDVRTNDEDRSVWELYDRTNDGPPRSTRLHYPRSDTRIRDDIAERLYRSADIDASDVSVEVKYAIVTLQGSAGSRRMKHDIEDLAADTPGVKDVENRIRVTVSAPDSTSSRRHDMSQGNAERPRRGFATPDLDPPPGGLHTPQHQEWLLDEGVEESFPASDTPSSIQPGSIAASEQSGKS
jgi:hypothetical protein